MATNQNPPVIGIPGAGGNNPALGETLPFTGIPLPPQSLFREIGAFGTPTNFQYFRRATAGAVSLSLAQTRTITLAAGDPPRNQFQFDWRGALVTLTEPQATVYLQTSAAYDYHKLYLFFWVLDNTSQFTDGVLTFKLGNSIVGKLPFGQTLFAPSAPSALNNSIAQSRATMSVFQGAAFQNSTVGTGLSQLSGDMAGATMPAFTSYYLVVPSATYYPNVTYIRGMFDRVEAKFTRPDGSNITAYVMIGLNSGFAESVPEY